jgi:xylan 1,4-beta-xylosidase
MKGKNPTARHSLRNPVLPGFNPDPAICRVGDDLYIATSTFEWYPGVQIFHSRDLVNWRLVCRPLSRANQLDMRGNPDCGGIWAPGLSHADGRFWLVYTDMKRRTGNYKDAHNYLVTSPSIEGPWTDPVYLCAGVFDPSMFHDDDGHKWLLAALHDHRARPTMFAGIVAQEYSPVEARLVGEKRVIFSGTELGMTEAPHLMRRGTYYYLVVAEGGTGYDHAVTHARSSDLFGPYEIHPDRHPITAKDSPQSALQRAGHGQIVELADGSVWHTHLCSRPIPGTRLSPLGRESAIQRCDWPVRARSLRKTCQHRICPRTLGPKNRSAAPSSRASHMHFSGCARRTPTACFQLRRGPDGCGFMDAKVSVRVSSRRWWREG